MITRDTATASSASPTSPIFALARIWSWRSNAVTAAATDNASGGANNNNSDMVSPSKPTRRVPTLRASPSLNPIPENAGNKSRPKSPESLPPSPKPSPRRVLSKSEYVLDCSSGDVPKTHGAIIDASPECKQSAVVVHHDSFLCQDAVNTTRLLNLSRKRVLEKVCKLGGNAIVDERWSCTVHKQDSKRETRYKVVIVYRGIPARSQLPDPNQPISLHEVKGVPGLMTIISRQSKYESPSQASS